MNIKVKQRDITDCGAACLASVAAHYKLKLPIARIRQIAGTDKKGTNLYGMIQAAEQLGFTAKGVKGKSDSLPKIPLPAIAHVIINKKLQHYIVIIKANSDQIEYMDPADGKTHKLKINSFEEIWTNVLLLLVPSKDFSATNEKLSIYKRFLFLLKPHKIIILQALFGAIIYTILGLSTSIYLQKLIDHVFINGNTNLLNLLSTVMLLIVTFQIFIGIQKGVFMLKTGQKIDAQLILGYYKHLLKLPQRFFDTMRVGEIISRVNDAAKIRIFINDTAVSLIVNLFIILFSFLLMFFYSWKLALILAIVIPVYATIYLLNNSFNKKRERNLMENSAELESQLVESLNAIKTIKQFGIESFSNLKTETRFIKLLNSVYKSSLNGLFSKHSSDALSKIFTIIILWSGSYFVVDKSITPGTLLSFYAIIGYFTNPVSQHIGMNKTIQNALIAADRLFEIMDLERETNENKIDLNKNNMGHIIFNQVAFSYGTHTSVFKNLNLTIKQGKLTAIIGESGSGKTTLAALLQKLYPLNEGYIKIGDKNINYFNDQSLRKRVSSVPQQLNLFAGNVVENIAVGEFKPNMERILKICNDLGMLEFVESLPAGFATYLGENGATISGGQKQRLAIARAIYKDPEILIMDEATSSLDSESEYFVQKAILKLKEEGKTIIIIAHRLSSIIDADEIILLEKGEVLEQGSHFELFNKQSKYYCMWQKQMPLISNTINETIRSSN